jgi:hypothetical protein
MHREEDDGVRRYYNGDSIIAAWGTFSTRMMGGLVGCPSCATLAVWGALNFNVGTSNNPPAVDDLAPSRGTCSALTLTPP